MHYQRDRPDIPSPSCSVGPIKAQPINRLRFFVAPVSSLRRLHDCADHVLAPITSKQGSAALWIAGERGASAGSEGWRQSVSDARFSPAFGNGGAEDLFAVTVGHADEQAANFLAAGAREFCRDFTGQSARILDGAALVSATVVDCRVIAQVKVEAVHWLAALR
jgi:hypothetical protein